MRVKFDESCVRTRYVAGVPVLECNISLGATLEKQSGFVIRLSDNLFSSDWEMGAPVQPDRILKPDNFVVSCSRDNQFLITKGEGRSYYPNHLLLFKGISVEERDARVELVGKESAKIMHLANATAAKQSQIEVVAVMPPDSRLTFKVSSNKEDSLETVNWNGLRYSCERIGSRSWSLVSIPESHFRPCKF